MAIDRNEKARARRALPPKRRSPTACTKGNPYRNFIVVTTTEPRFPVGEPEPHLDRGNPVLRPISEVSLREVGLGLIEAAHAMGANRATIVWEVLSPEALPGLAAGLSFAACKPPVIA